MAVSIIPRRATRRIDAGAYSLPAPARFLAAPARDARLRATFLRGAGFAAAVFVFLRAAAFGSAGVAACAVSLAGAVSAAAGVAGVLRRKRPRRGGAASSSALHS